MFCWDFPIDTEGVIENADTSICFRMVKVITLVLEDGCFRKNGESMGKALWDEELDMIVFGQFYSHMLAIGRPLRISTATSSTLPFTQRTNLL